MLRQAVSNQTVKTHQARFIQYLRPFVTSPSKHEIFARILELVHGHALGAPNVTGRINK